MDDIQQDQDVIALRQLIEQTYANNPGVLDALRQNADAFDLELRSLPSGSLPSVAIEQLKTQQWFREAESTWPLHSSQGLHPDPEGIRPSVQAVPRETRHANDVLDQLRVAPYPDTRLRPKDTYFSWLDDATLSRLAGQGAVSPSMWAQRYDPNCPSEFYRGYATLLLWIGEAFRANANLAALGQLIETLDSAIKALPADERRNGANFALMNVAAYSQAGSVPQILATLAAELVCIARCFVSNQARGL